MSTRARGVADIVRGVAIVVLCSAPAFGQVIRSIEVSGGYALMDDPTERLHLSGWDLGMAAGLNGWLSIAADAGGHYKTVPLFDETLSLRAHTLMGGLRASTHLGPVVGFGQVLAGISRGGGTAFGSSDSETHVAWQPGAGVDVPVGDRVAVRGEFDRRSLADVHEFRFVAAIALKWRRQ